MVDVLQAATRWKTVTSVEGKDPVETEILDLFTLDDSGKLVSLVQFCDTAMLAVLCS